MEDAADPVKYIVAKNDMRRHLTASQRAIVAHRLWRLSNQSSLREEGVKGGEHQPSLSQRQAAALLQVSKREINYAREVLNEASTVDPAVRNAVEQGILTVSDGSRVIAEPPEVQRAALEQVMGGQARTITGAVKQIRQDIVLQQEANALASNLAKDVSEVVTLHHSSVSELHQFVRAATVDVIMTNPPVGVESLPLLAGLSGFAAHTLGPGGVMVVMGTGLMLPRELDALKHSELKWVVEMDYLLQDPPMKSRDLLEINVRRRPLFVYGKPGARLKTGDDLIQVPALDEAPPARPRWHQYNVGMTQLVQRFTHSGQVVCDPFLKGRAGTALGARENGCSFIGADTDRSSLRRVWEILNQFELRDRS